jgi:hypothetical protein
MPIPNYPPHNAPRKPFAFSPKLAEIQAMLNAVAESDRMTRLVDYLEDLRKEFDWAAAELKTLGFCAPCYLSELDDGDDHDCIEKDI